MKVRDVLRSKGGRIVSIEDGATVAEAISRLVENNIGSLPVTDPSGRLVGMISERDVLRLIHRHGEAFGRVKISDVMTPDPEYCDLDHDVEAVMGKMSECRIAKVPVLCDSELCGIISVGDVVKVLYEKAQVENNQLMSYIHGAY
jgi:CBS domain-containing protein